VPTITFHASHFHGHGPKGRHDLEVPWEKLVWAAITIGKWRDDLFIRGRYSAFEATHRANLLWAYLCCSASRRYVRTDAYDELDATEKAGVSYAIGMTAAKIFAAERLGVPWLMHLDRYRLTFGVRLRRGRRRPDLIGPRDPDAQMEWLVAEAKGRTHELDSEAVSAMRQQKRRVLTIAGARPFLYMGAAAHFTSGELEHRVVDPPPARRAGNEVFQEYVDVKRQFARAYYEPLVELLEQAERLEDGLVMRELSAADAHIGMRRERFAAIRQYIRGELDDIDLRVDPETQWSDTFGAPDGVAIRLGRSWEDERMTEQPRERAR
jgi:hypothetical protein